MTASHTIRTYIPSLCVCVPADERCPSPRGDGEAANRRTAARVSPHTRRPATATATATASILSLTWSKSVPNQGGFGPNLVQTVGGGSA
jgi:hypothetical protein